jgi:polysaccharide biosynthesis protein VpsJ
MEVETVRSSLLNLEKWSTGHDYKGYEPFDGLNSWARRFAFNKFGRQILVQSGVRLPFNLRPILGIQPATSTKAMGYFARGYLKLFQVTSEEKWREKMQLCLDWLRENANRNYPGVSWGNHFDYQTRGYYLEKYAPTVVWTALVGHAFLEAFVAFGRSEDLETANQAADFIIKGLERRQEGRGKCISYVPVCYLAVHNANMLAAGFLGRTYQYKRDSEMYNVASEAVAYSMGCQRKDGSWWYGEAPNFHWVDNWHTAYVLDSLRYYMQGTGDDSYKTQYDLGLKYWLDHFFCADGEPKFYSDRGYCVDIQCASQAIESLSLLAENKDLNSLQRAEMVIQWTINHMQDKDGHFYYQRNSFWINKTSMLHWGQATMFNALAGYLHAKLY